MTSIPITSLFVAAFALALVALSLPISLRRMKVGVLEGVGTDEALHRRIRTQGNFIEYVPLALIALGLAEAQGAPAWNVLLIGGALAAGRLLHAIGMLQGAPALRGFGMILTYLSLILAAVDLAIHALR